MTKPTSNDTRNPSANSAANQGRINTQGKEGGTVRRDQSRIDQSEGAKGGGQPTSHQGQGAGFSRKGGPAK